GGSPRETRGTLWRQRAVPDPGARPRRRSHERVYAEGGAGRAGRAGGATRPKLRKLEPRTQAHYCSAMTQTQKVLIALGIVAVTGIAANRFAPAWSGGPGDACRRFVAEARRTCYSQLLSERLNKHGVADAVATLDALAA